MSKFWIRILNLTRRWFLALLQNMDKMINVVMIQYCLDKPVSKLRHWTSKHGRRKPGRPVLNYRDILKQDTGMEDCNEE